MHLAGRQSLVVRVILPCNSPTAVWDGFRMDYVYASTASQQALNPSPHQKEASPDRWGPRSGMLSSCQAA
eukprot:scaffold3166_cov399-Prasinococcus_capsulatus_cf.AAC.5